MDIVEKRCDLPLGSGRNKKICGKPVPNNEPTEFALDDRAYAADLCEQHRKEIADAIAKFVAIARPTRAITSTTTRGRKVMRTNAGRTFTTRDVRDWLAEQGREVPASGRMPETVLDEYRAKAK